MIAEQRAVVGREEVLAQGEERPENDVAVRVAGAALAVARKKPNHCGQSPSDSAPREDPEQDVAHGTEAAERSRSSTAPADVARSPAAARVLLEAARRQEVDERVLREPRQDLLHAPDLGGAGRRVDGDGAAHVRPERVRAGTVVVRRRTRGARRGILREARDQREARVRGRLGDDREERLRPRAAVEKSASSPATRDRRARAGIDPEKPRGEARAEIRLGMGPHDDAGRVSLPPDRHGPRAVVAREGHGCESRNRQGAPSSTRIASVSAWRPSAAPLSIATTPPG